MGSPRGLDRNVIGRLLEAIHKYEGRAAPTVIHGAANLNPETYDMYCEILIATGDVTMTSRPEDGKIVPILTKDGYETLQGCRREAARFGKENLRVEEIRRAHAVKRKQRNAGKKNPTADTDPHEDST